ncbi:MAG: type II toxin-antitoxin system VapC family toxin [Candidatus Heimdallarchaeota archaeon]
MIFLDTDIFVIDRFFPDDERGKTNHDFLDLAAKTNAGTSIFNVLEIVGIASFNLNRDELTSLFTMFAASYKLQVLYPSTTFMTPEDFLAYLIESIFKKICKQMHFPDALILNVAEQNNCSNFITWNKKHFINRTGIEVQTPEEYLQTG